MANGDDCNALCQIPGSELFFTLYHDGPNDRCYDLLLSDDGTFLVTGFVTNETNEDVLLQRYDGEGQAVWTQTWDSGVDEQGWGVAENELAIAVVGYTHLDQERHPWVGAFLDNGTLFNESTIPTAGQFLDVVARQDNSAVIVGEVVSMTGNDPYIVQIDSEGQVIWESIYNDGGDGQYAAMLVDEGAGSVFVSGTTSSGELLSFPSAIVGHYELETGSLLDTFTYDSTGSGRTGFWGMAPHFEDPQRLLVAGTASTGDQGWQMWFGSVSKSEAGAVDLPVYGLEGNDEAFAIAQDAEGYLYVGGFITQASQNAIIRKLSPDGTEELWVWAYDGDGGQTDRTWDLVLDTDGSVLACGYSSEVGTGYDLWVARLAQ